MELFQDTNSDAAMSDTDVISFQGDTYLGSDEGDPVALVNATADTAADKKAKPIPGKVQSEYPLDMRQQTLLFQMDLIQISRNALN